MLAVQAPDIVLDPGERALWAHALTRNDDWILCGPDKASLRFGVRLGFRERLVALEALARCGRPSTEGSLAVELHRRLACAGAERDRACRRDRNAHDRASPIARRPLLHRHRFRRDLVGPGPQDADLARERLNENPSRWYLTGFLAPANDPLAQDGPQASEDDPSVQEEIETDMEEPAEEGAGGAAGDDAPPETPSTKRRFLPSSIGLTVLLPPDVREIEARVSWGDYRTEPPLPEDLFLPDEDEETGEDGKRKKKERPFVEWVREPEGADRPPRGAGRTRQPCRRSGECGARSAGAAG